jgi:uncharacterized hydrophobic protein (TIGR00271 family)
MRHVRVQARPGRGDEVVAAARDAEAGSISRWAAADAEGAQVELVDAYLPNRRVEEFVQAVTHVGAAPLIISPRGDLLLSGEAAEVAGHLREVTLRSPIEILLGGVQSIGSWRGFLAYALAAGVVVWLGLVTDTIYLLVAAMLLSPYAGPAMNVAIATARGDLALLWRSVLRYSVALALTILVAGAMSLIFAQDVATATMFQVANVSALAVVLPLTAGAAGALNLIQSERSSLVSGAAVGMVVAASLAPPAGLIGMAAVIGRFDMAITGLLILAVQLVAINLAGAIVFRLAGMHAEGPRYSRGRAAVSLGAFIATAIGVAAFLAVQFAVPSPELERATVEQRTRSVVRDTLEQRTDVQAVDIQARFTRPDIGDQNTILIEAYLQTGQALGDAAQAELRNELRVLLQDTLLEAHDNLTPLISIELLSPPHE